MMRRGAAFLATLVSLVGPVRAADIAPSSWKYENPFCKVVANVMPVTGRAAYAVAVYTASGTLIDAHVTLVGETDAFDAHVVSAPLSGPADNRQSAPILVTLPTGQSASYFFVDSYSIDNAQPVTCPSYVFSAGARTVDELLDAAWTEVPELLRPAATVTLAAHLDKLADEGRLPDGVQRPAKDSLTPSEPQV